MNECWWQALSTESWQNHIGLPIRDQILSTNHLVLSVVRAEDGCSGNGKRVGWLASFEYLLGTRHIAKKGPHSQSYGFSSTHVWM